MLRMSLHCHDIDLCGLRYLVLELRTASAAAERPMLYGWSCLSLRYRLLVATMSICCYIQVARDVSSVQALCERLSGGGELAGQEVELAGRTVSVVKSADAAVPKTWSPIAMIPVLEDALDSARGLFKLRKANSKSSICTVTSSATAPPTHLSDGVLKLRAESCITFDHSCTDFKLSSITVKGVTPPPCQQAYTTLPWRTVLLIYTSVKLSTRAGPLPSPARDLAVEM